MHLKYIKFGLPALIILLGVVSCKSDQKNIHNTIAVEKTDSCQVNPSHKYEVFIPAHNESIKTLPLLVAIDPHGDGKLALNLFKQAATEYPAVVIGSNLIQNNDPNYMNEMEELIADVKKRYPVNDMLYLSGFSGGARMILNFAANHPVNGVIACGAFANEKELQSIKCPVMSITGMDDFNFMESAQYVLNPSQTPKQILVELTNETHAWPHANILTGVWGYFRVFGTGGDKHQVKKYAEQQMARVNSLENNGSLLQAVMISRNMGLNSAVNDAADFKSRTGELMKNSVYEQQRNQLMKGLQLEMKVRQAYMKALEDNGADWWSKEVASLNMKISDATDEISRDTYQRIKGFLGIVCYSYCNRYAAQKNVAGLEHILAVYRIAEPYNEDMKHFTEVLAELKNN